MGTIDCYGRLRLRLTRRVNDVDELRRVGLDHLTTEEATTRAREIKFVKAGLRLSRPRPRGLTSFSCDSTMKKKSAAKSITHGMGHGDD